MHKDKSTTEKIDAVIQRHFNRYFKEQFITPNMNEWSALRRSIKKLIADEQHLHDKQLEEINKKLDDQTEETRRRINQATNSDKKLKDIMGMLLLPSQEIIEEAHRIQEREVHMFSWACGWSQSFKNGSMTFQDVTQGIELYRKQHEKEERIPLSCPSGMCDGSIKNCNCKK